MKKNVKMLKKVNSKLSDQLNLKSSVILFATTVSVSLIADGLRKWTEHKKLAKGESLVMFCLTAVMAFPYVTEYYLYFEHTLYPLCFTLQLIGWLFHFYSKPTFFIIDIFDSYLFWHNTSCMLDNKYYLKFPIHYCSDW